MRSLITKKPIIVAEFGYSSYGGVLTEEEKTNKKNISSMKDTFGKRGLKLEDMDLSKEYESVVEVILAMHYYKKWGYEWRGEHSPRVQVEYLEKAYDIFKSNPNVIGAMWFCWRDTTHYFWCGQEGCPCEIAWGLVDVNGKPKDAFYNVNFLKFSD